MKIALILVIASFFFLGCLQPPVSIPVPTATPTATETPSTTPSSSTPTPALTPTPVEEPTMYRVWMDTSDFNILNFTIRVGDSVRWINDHSYDFPLTVVSNEGLWAGRTGLTRYQTERFEYMFNKTETYTFSIGEYRRLKNQTITVVP